ncbi:MAG: Hsp20/alpha crystallin family protein [Clostridiales bacterium]|nr:Hsp20/alpha crystallin family protein [Clostridiales bacterium]
MLVPRIFEETLLDDFVRFPERNVQRSTASLMETDIEEKGDCYILTMELAGYSKKDVKAELKDGNLIIQATREATNEDKDENGKYLRRERFYGNCRRNFYVGKDVEQKDISAKFEDGVLTLTIPKKSPAPKVENTNYISIEG